MSRRYAKRRTRYRDNKATRALLITLIVVALCVLGLSGYKLVSIMRSYKASDDYYEDVIDIFDEDTGVIGETDEATGFKWDYDKLLDLCSDAVGYIYQKGVMSYPIVQAEDNDKYLRTMMNGEYNVGGTIFVDARFPLGMEGKYSIVYGHNMYNASMFGTLPKYTEEEYYLEHPYFDIYIGYKHYRYYVFSAFVADADGFVYTFDLNYGDYKPFYDRLRESGNYQTKFRELTEDDHVIVLSTCVDWHDYAYRNVVCLVRGEEVDD